MADLAAWYEREISPIALERCHDYEASQDLIAAFAVLDVGMRAVFLKVPEATAIASKLYGVMTDDVQGRQDRDVETRAVLDLVDAVTMGVRGSPEILSPVHMLIGAAMRKMGKVQEPLSLDALRELLARVVEPLPRAASQRKGLLTIEGAVATIIERSRRGSSHKNFAASVESTTHRVRKLKREALRRRRTTTPGRKRSVTG